MRLDRREEALAILKAVLALGRLRAERPEGAVTLPVLSLLATLNRLGPIPATRLAAEERLQPQSLTRLIDTLEGDGLIERQRSPVDRRALVIGVTEKGRAVWAKTGMHGSDGCSKQWRRCSATRSASA